MKRNETIGNATIYLGDCRDVLPQVGKIDAVLADPPYGMNLGAISGGVKDRFRHSNGFEINYTVTGDDKPFDPSHLLGFSKLIIWGGNHFASRLPDARKWLVWDKREGGTSDNQADCELAWTNLPGPERLHAQKWRGMIRAGEENVACGSYRCHPTQKPVALMCWCIEQFGSADTICDPYMGSGTVGIAAIRLGRKFIGIEIEEKHFDTACRRIEVEARKPNLFAQSSAHGQSPGE